MITAEFACTLLRLHIWLLQQCSLPSRIYGNNICRWVKLWKINHVSIGRLDGYFTALLPQIHEAYWYYGNNQITAITRCTAVTVAFKMIWKLKNIQNFSLIIEKSFVFARLLHEHFTVLLQIAVVAVMCKPHRCPHISMTGNICV